MALRMGGAKAKAITPAEKLRASESRIASHKDTQPASFALNVGGIDSVDVLLDQFLNCMSDLLDESMAAIAVKLEMMKQVCSDLDRTVHALETENKQLKSTVNRPSERKSADLGAQSSEGTAQPED